MAGKKHLEPSCLGCLFFLSQVLSFSFLKVILSVSFFKVILSVGDIKANFRKFSAAPPPPAEPAAQESFLSGIISM